MKSLLHYVSLIIITGLSLLVSCTDNEEPAPFDCNTSNLDIEVTASTGPTGCGEDNGSIQVAASGGQAPFQFKLDNGSFQNSNTFSNLGGGSFTVVVKDSRNCEITSAPIILNAAEGLQVDSEGLVITPHTNCSNPNGSITVTVSEGTPPYSYKLGAGSFGSSATFSNLKGGNYSITAQDAADCEVTISATVAMATGVSYQTDIKPILEASCTKSGCHNGDNGAAMNWNVFANVEAKATLIKNRTGNKSMPLDIAPAGLPQAQIDLIACWVDSGALNN